MSLLDILDRFIVKAEPEWKAMHRVADKRLPKVTIILGNAFKALKNSIDVDELAKQPIAMMADKIDWSIFEDKCDALYNELGLILADSGETAATYLSNKLMTKLNDSVKKADIELTGSFDMRNPAAVSWAQKHTGEMITQVNTNSREGIKQILTDAQAYGGHPYETARQIRQYIGLTDNQMAGVLKKQHELDAEGRPKAQVDAMIDAEVRRRIRARAVTIARTETIAAAAHGQQLHWEDQLRKGYLDKNNMVKAWIVTPDDKLCPICAAMKDEKTGIDEEFLFGGKCPPRHPNCRCSIGLEEKQGSELETYMGTPEGQDWTKIDQLLGLEPETVKGNWGNVEYTDNLKAVDKRLTWLKQAFPLKQSTVYSHGDLLLEKQAAWDLSLKLNMEDYIKANPGVAEKKAKTEVLKLMTERPTKVPFERCGEYFNTRIGINPNTLFAETSFEDAVKYRTDSLAHYAERAVEGKKKRYLQNVAHGSEATMIHEYGHAVKNDLRLWSDSDFHKYFESLSYDEIAEGVSEYATTNVDEFFAECFSEIHMPNPRAVAVKAMQLVGIEIPKGV